MIKNLVFMPIRILLLLFLSLGVQSLTAQDQAYCTPLLEDAREAYEAGMVELVPDLLLNCIRSNGLSGEARVEAFKLVINSYIFDYLSAEADSLMDDFVSEFPGYRAENSDPQEFVFLLDAHLTAMGIDPTEIPEDTTEFELIKVRSGYFSRRILTKGAGEYGNTVGFMVGSPFSFATTREAYSVGDPSQDEGHFGLLPGLMVGAEANLILNIKMEASFGLDYYLSRLSYSATPLSSVSYRYVEAQHQVLIPLSLIYKFNPDNMKVCYYMRGGLVPSYTIAASGKGTRTHEATQDELTVSPVDVSASRVKLNLDVMLGAGARIPLNKAFIFAELRMNSRFFQANKEESRYLNNDINWLLYHVDSDFRVHQISICGGICWDLTKE